METQGQCNNASTASVAYVCVVWILISTDKLHISDSLGVGLLPTVVLTLMVL